jgi:outer membrane lipoprotein
MARVSLTMALAAVLFGCSVVSPGIREEAVELRFSEIARNPATHEGKTVILGGYVVSVQNAADSSRMMVLQSPLYYQHQPKARQYSQGRFMVVTDNFLDPMVYENGQKVTVAGTLLGKTTATVGEYEYQMPEIWARELHLWEEWSQRSPYYRDPYYHYPFWDPYFYPHWRYPYRW